MKLTDLLYLARRRYGPSVHLREYYGLREVIAYRALEYTGRRDESGVEVLASTRGSWASIGVAP